VELGRQLEARDGAGVDVDDYALEHRDDAVPGERIFPRAERRVPDLRLDEVHIAHFALVLLRRRNSFAIRRPQQDRPVAAGPTGVIGRVAKVLGAIGGELLPLAGRHVANPEVPIANEGGALAVGRHRHWSGRPTASAAPTAASAASAPPTGGRRIIQWDAWTV